MYPGSFNPPTIAHVAIAQTAIEQCHLQSVTFAVSQQALAKEAVDATDRPRMADRLTVLTEMAAAHDGFEVLLTPKQLIVDIAEGFDVVILGADKWLQIQDPVFYDDDVAKRDQALSRLPEVALVPRPPLSTGEAPTLRLDDDVAALIDQVSSTQARSGDLAMMVAAAQAFDKSTGAWTDRQRYERWLREETRG